MNVDEIAAVARVTKRTLYAHFRSKDELIAAAFEAQIELAGTAQRDLVAHMTGSAPAQMIESLFAGLETWSSRPRWSGSGFTRVAMELADLPGHPARVLARRHKRMVEDQLADLLEKAGVADAPGRAREIFMLSEGAMAMILIHGDRSYAKVAAEAAKRLITTSKKTVNKRPSQKRSRTAPRRNLES